MSEPVTYRGKRDFLVDRLSQAILRGELHAGEHLRQDEIAVRYGVSPTPVREALRVLEAMALVVYEPHRGVRVADIAGSAEQFYRLREALECLAVEMAVQNLTPAAFQRIEQAVADMEAAAAAADGEALHDGHRRFHLALYDASGFPALLDMIQLVWSRFPWDAVLALPEKRSLSVEDHRAIARLAASGDARATAERLAEHLKAVGRQLAGAGVERR
jgi:DNA-binding GntR family transcriptional regulator